MQLFSWLGSRSVESRNLTSIHYFLPLSQVEVILPKYDCLKYNLVEGIKLEGDFFFGNAQVKVWFLQAIFSKTPRIIVLETTQDTIQKRVVLPKDSDSETLLFEPKSTLVNESWHCVRPLIGMVLVSSSLFYPHSVQDWK